MDENNSECSLNLQIQPHLQNDSVNLGGVWESAYLINVPSDSDISDIGCETCIDATLNFQIFLHFRKTISFALDAYLLIHTVACM